MGSRGNVQEPEGWSRLWEQAQRERDPKKLEATIQQMNHLLTEHEKRAAGGAPDGFMVSSPRASVTSGEFDNSIASD